MIKNLYRLAILTASAVAATLTAPVSSSAAPLVLPGLDFGSSEGSSEGVDVPGLGETHVSRTVQWRLTAGHSAVNWTVQVTPRDDISGTPSQDPCVNDRTGGFTFTQRAEADQIVTRADDLWMDASASLAHSCFNQVSNQVWYVHIKAEPLAGGRQGYETTTGISYSYERGNLRIVSYHVYGDTSCTCPDVLVQPSGDDLFVTPPAPLPL